MTQRDWNVRLRILLGEVVDVVSGGLPEETIYLPGWRWQLDIFVMHSLSNPHDYDACQEVVNRFVSERGRPLPEISIRELPILAILEHGVCRPVLTDEQSIRLAFSPDTLEAVYDELAKVGQERGDMWHAAVMSRMVELPPLPTKSTEEIWEEWQQIQRRVEEERAAERAADEEDDAEDETDPSDPK